mmetsp:Transcript_23043/g.75122  ORF Transcript_23043/g.75122 Transcript_23043/m.75122 type:complete len:187 (+) Transcript_23043:2-562(+)
MPSPVLACVLLLLASVPASSGANGCTARTGARKDLWVGTWFLQPEPESSCTNVIANVMRRANGEYRMVVVKGNSTSDVSCAPHDCKGTIPDKAIVGYWFIYDWGDCAAGGRTYNQAAIQAWYDKGLNMTSKATPVQGTITIKGVSPWWGKGWCRGCHNAGYPTVWREITQEARAQGKVARHCSKGS